MKFIAHRGLDNHHYRENTLDAIVLSLNQDYISGVEFDVQMTKDEEIVLVHDLTINRVSDGSGFVRNMTLSELRKYNFGTKKNKSLVATLQDVLKRIKKTQKKILIEIKGRDIDVELMLNRVAMIVKRYPKLNIYFCSFNLSHLKKLKLMFPNHKIGLISRFDVQKNDEADFYVINYRYYKWGDSDEEIYLWTLNNAKDFYFLENKLSPNISIITDVAYKLYKTNKS